MPINLRSVFNEIEYDTNSHSFIAIVTKLLYIMEYGIWISSGPFTLTSVLE